MHFSMANYAVDGVLAGSLPGKQCFACLVADTVVPTKPEIFFLDFQDVKVVTSLFLRDSAIAYRNHARSAWPHAYPGAANLSKSVREEFEIWLGQTADVFVVCDVNANGQTSNVMLLGQMDEKQLVALRGVIALGETDVASLANHSDETVAPTAWNNRLGALVSKGLVIELMSSGRSKRYRPILEGLTYGT